MLDKVTITTCPFCMCTKVKEDRRFDQHCNGGWNERRQFDCGYVVEYSPNFCNTTSHKDLCTRAKENEVKQGLRKAYLKHLRDSIAGAPVDEDFQKILLQALEFVRA